MTATPVQFYASNLHLTNGDVNFLADANIKMAALTAYTPSQAHETWADVLAAGTEANGSGYTARGKAITGKTITRVGAVTTFDSDDIAWTTANPGRLDARWLVLYKDTGTNSTSYVLAYYDLEGVTKTATDGGALSYAIPGLLRLTAV